MNTEISPNIDTAAGQGTAIGVGDINISWHDDLGKLHHFVLKDVFHIPDSPVNILGISAFSKIIGDYESKGTRINSSGQDSIFTWNNGRFQRTFEHLDVNMPALPVNTGFLKFHKFCNFVESINPIKAQCYHVAKTPKTLDRLLYYIGEEVMYHNAAHVEKGIIENITYNGDMKIPTYHIKFKDNREVRSPAEMLKSTDKTDMATIPINPKDFVENSKMLTVEELKNLNHPLPLSKLEKEWIRMHDKYGHLSFAEMDKLVINNVLPKKFAKLKGKTFVCPSCAFGKMKKRVWRSKGSANSKQIRKPAQNYPGAKVSTDQIVVAQPGLVPRLSGRHTHERICGATCFIDHHSGYSFSSLQTSLDGEQTLAAKVAYESHADTCGVKVSSYRADNGRFAEKSFREAVKRAQQTIDFCAVGAHH